MASFRHVILSGVNEIDPCTAELRVTRLFSGIDKADKSAVWARRRFPVLSVLAPCVSDSRHKIEFPGDPMCLYHALSLAVSKAYLTYQQGLSHENPFPDFCPFWDLPPSSLYRQQVLPSGIRRFSDIEKCTTDGSVFDPRVWNSQIEYFFRELLRLLQPRVVLVSCVSPAFRFAVRILEIVRDCLPFAVTILGGRHIDATTTVNDAEGTTSFSVSSPVTESSNGFIGDTLDFLVAGEGYWGVLACLKAAAISIPASSECGFPVRDNLVPNLTVSASGSYGMCSVVAFGARGTKHVFRLTGPPIDRSSLPSPYNGFAIRARFPIFKSADGIKLTAHVNTGVPCPFTCDFCSESRVLQKATMSRARLEERIVEEMMFLRRCGAEAIFFDDSVFLGGSARRLLHFSNLVRALFGIKFEWGAQLTISVLESFADQGKLEDCLSSIRSAGCTYLYFGLESLATEVMAPISKTRRVSPEENWEARVVKSLKAVKLSGLRAGASILFGLKGETLQTIDSTVLGVERLLSDGLLSIASPNLMTYHPGTAITNEHNAEERLTLRYSHLGNFVRPPYAFFEEAFPGLVSRELHEDLVWHIHQETQKRWGLKRNSDVMPPIFIPDDYAF